MPKKTPAAALDPTRVVSQTLPEDAANALVVQATLSNYSDERDLVNQLLGQVQATESLRKISQTIGVSKLLYVKESKVYKSLKGMRTNGLELKGTWQEFCELLGMSDEKANSDIANFKTFGEEALRSMTSMGIGYRELRAFRSLPEDSRAALIQAAREGDKEQLLDLAEELISQQEAEKASLQKTQQEAEARAARLERQAAEKDEQIDELKGERKRLRQEWSRKGLDERVVDLRAGVQAAAVDVLSALSPGQDDPAGLHGAIRALLEDELAAATDHADFLAGVFNELIANLCAVRDSLPVSVPTRGA